MRRACVGLVVALLAVTGCGAPTPPAPEPFFQHDLTGATPWTKEPSRAPGADFSFAIFSDLNGGERPGIFDVAVSQLALLQPALVLSVGDLIDGGSETPQGLHAEWDAFDARTARLEAPVFYTGGNHDLTSEQMRDVWVERYGALHYWFVYGDALFLVLDSEDYGPERRREIHAARQAAIALIDSGREAEARQTEYYRMPERVSGNIGEAQARFFAEVLAAHGDVRWTFLFVHKPVWLNEDSPGLRILEEALAERPYTFFSGHFHSYRYTLRRGRDHITLGTTGGSQGGDDPRSFDHVTLVHVGEGEPTIANLRLDGILDRTGQLPGDGDALCFQASRCGRGSE